MTIGIAVIGAGLMGADHALRVEREIKGAHLAVLADLDTERAAEVIAESGSTVARVEVDPSAAIAADDVDAVIIAAPDHFHVPLTLAALRAGKHVLCEKPLAPTATECLEVLELEQQLASDGAAPRVTLGFMRRFDPGCMELRQTRESGELGEALMLHCAHRNVDPYPGDSEHTVTASAVHEFDFVPWLLGSEVTTVSWQAGKSSSRTTRRDPQLVLLETADGVLTTLELFMSAEYGYEVRGELVFERGTQSLRDLPLTDTRHALAHRTAFPVDSTRKYAEAYRGELQAWIASIRAGASPDSFGLATAWDGYAAAAVAEAVIESLRAGDARRVGVSTIERPELYR
jgi:myo-inositol 2-dehydrogenase/D-chiro-inositol 1-dehydrogenase